MPNLIERISGLLERCTPGKWDASVASSVVGSLIHRQAHNIAAVMPQAQMQECESNAQLIAELRNAAPALMDALAAAKEWRDATDAVAANYMCSEQRLELAEAALRSKLAALDGGE